MHTLGILSRLIQALPVTLALCFSLSAADAAEIVQYDFTGTSLITNSREGTSPLNITPVTLVRGAGLGGASANNAFSSNGWTGEATDYIEFGFDVAPGFEVDLDNIQLSAQASGTGPAALGVFTSADSYTTSVATITAGNGSLVQNLLDINSLPVVTGNFRFRLKVIPGTLAANGAAIGSGGTFRLANYATTPVAVTMQVTGTVQNAGGTVTPTAPAVASLAPASGSTNVSTSSTFAVTFNQPVNVATGWFSLVGSTSGNITAGVVVSGGPTTFTLTPGTAFTYSETATLTINAAFITSQATSANPAANTTATYTIAPPPGSATAINSIQGISDTSPLNGQTVTVQGIVTGFFFSTAGVRQGFYLQAPDSAVDANPLTSEGLYIYFGTSPSFTSALATVASGDAVTVSGTVVEYKGTTDTTTLTELTTITGLTVSSSGNPLPADTPVTLPFSSLTYLERLEGMRVTFPQTLYVTDTFGLGRYGEVELSSGGILPQPTNVAAPGTSALLQQTANNLNRIVLDDTIAAQNPDPTPYLFGGATSTENTLRGGDTLVELTGVVTNIASLWMIQPTATPLFERENPRPAPPAVGGNLKVVGFNVLNYFNGFGLPNGLADTNNRGADNTTELDRQRAHIITSLVKLDADIYGLTELQNNGSGPSSAIQDLLNRLNAAVTNGSIYALVNLPSYPQPPDSDYIKCGFLYKTNTVGLVGNSVFNAATTFSRPAIAQTFKKLSNGEKLTVSINHFKSKGGSGASGLDLDQNDGQGAYNNRRTLQAQALTAWLATFPTGDTDPDILIIGDLNAYAKEDPITAIVGAGYTNLTELYEGPTGYSYSFDGQWGHLDHALGTATLTAQVSSAQAWHSNADEPVVLDYNQEFKTPAQQSINAGNTPWRSSDHDPIVVGLKLYSPIEAWRVTYFNSPANTGSAGDDFDYDGDGLSNLLEYGLGLDPKVPSATGRPTLAVDSGVATFSFARARSGLNYIVQSTENLAVPSSWTDTEINPGSVGQTVPVNITLPPSGRLFLRLKITQPSP